MRIPFRLALLGALVVAGCTRPPTVTVLPPGTETPTLTPEPSPSQLPTSTTTPTSEPTPEPLFPFALQNNTIVSSNTEDCDLITIGGQPFTPDERPYVGLLVHLEGGGLALDAITGSADYYGPAGYEFLIVNPDVSVTDEYFVWLTSPGGVQLSDLTPVNFSGACDANWLFVNWNQVGEWNPLLVETPVPTPVIETRPRHVVTAGETLGIIGHRYYGRADAYVFIAAINSIANPNLVEVGQELVIDCDDLNWPCLAQP